MIPKSLEFYLGIIPGFGGSEEFMKGLLGKEDDEDDDDEEEEEEKHKVIYINI